MLPRLVKTDNLAPIRADRKILHEMACQYGEEQFKLKGGMAALWIVASGPNIAWIETDWKDNREKDIANYAMRQMLDGTAAQAYSFITEAWMMGTNAKMSEPERKHWLDFSQKHGVRSLPEHMRDDVLMILSFDRKGGCSNTRYVVQMRKGKGPNYLGPRIDEDGLTSWGGRMGNLFKPEQDTDEIMRKAEAIREAEETIAAKAAQRSAKQ